MKIFIPIIVSVALILAIGAEGAILAKPLVAAKITTSTSPTVPARQTDGWRLRLPSKKSKKKALKTPRPTTPKTTHTAAAPVKTPDRTGGIDSNSPEQKLKYIKEEVAAFNKQRLQSESHYQRIEKDLTAPSSADQELFALIKELQLK